jgi:hypothetical protein
VVVRPGGPDEYCDFLYVLCVGRPPCAVQVRDADVPPPGGPRCDRPDNPRRR